MERPFSPPPPAPSPKSPGMPLLVDPLETAAITQGMQTLVHDETLRQTLVQKGLENVKRFNWEETAVQLLQTLEKDHLESS